MQLAAFHSKSGTLYKRNKRSVRQVRPRMNVIGTDIPEVVIIEPKVFGDQRGFFLETYNAARYAPAGIAGPFVQDNLSRSARGVLRGLHLQNPRTQGKLVSVLRGRV